MVALVGRVRVVSAQQLLSHAAYRGHALIAARLGRAGPRHLIDNCKLATAKLSTWSGDPNAASDVAPIELCAQTKG